MHLNVFETRNLQERTHIEYHCIVIVWMLVFQDGFNSKLLKCFQVFSCCNPNLLCILLAFHMTAQTLYASEAEEN